MRLCGCDLCILQHMPEEWVPSPLSPWACCREVVRNLEPVVKEPPKADNMAHERDQLEGGFSVEAIRRSLAGPPEQRRGLADWLLAAVDREVRIILKPIALRYRRNLRDEAEDLSQDVLLQLFHDGGRVLLSWDPARGMQLRSFLSLVVRRYIYRRFRGFRGNPWSSDPAAAEELAARLDDGIAAEFSLLTDIEYRLHLDEILAVLQGELSDRDWRLFTKLYVDQRKPVDVGEEEDMRENAVHKWVSRFQQRVRQLFARTQRPARASRTGTPPSMRE